MELPTELMAVQPHFDDVLAWQWRKQEFGHDETLKEIVRRGGALEEPRVRERRRPNGRFITMYHCPEAERSGHLPTLPCARPPRSRSPRRASRPSRRVKPPQGPAAPNPIYSPECLTSFAHRWTAA